MSRIVNKAELELDMFLEQEKTINKSIKPKILKMLEIFSNQGHSGMSAGLVINLFKTASMEQLVEAGAFDEEKDFYGGMTGEVVKELVDKFTSQDYGNAIQRKIAQDIFITLAKQQPILPIMNVDMEWGEPTFSDDDTFQNKRLSSVFKKGEDGRPYYLDSIVWKNQNGSCWGGTALFHIPGTEEVERIGPSHYIKVPFEPRTFYIDVIEEEVTPDDWEFHIKDPLQLEEVFEYYDKKVIEQN